MHLLDTNICIYLLNSRSAPLHDKVMAAGELAISSVTYAELCFGIENGSKKRAAECWSQLGLFKRLVQVLPFGEEVAVHYGKVRADLKRRGQLIGANDLLIAAHALSLGAVLVTNNEREFRRVPGLELENWV